MSKSRVYLDYAAATPMDDLVLLAMKPYFSDKFYNPSATYISSRSISGDIEKARGQVASWLGAKPTEIVFTAGGTEANNLAIKGVMNSYPDGNLVISAIEHESILEPAKKYKHELSPVKLDGVIDLGKLGKLIDDNTVFVSVMYANNEIGTIEPLRQVSKLVQEVRAKRLKLGNKVPIYLHSDACQAPAYLDLHVSRLGVDLMTLNAGKIYGPKQTGALYVNRTVTIQPEILGGGQEMGLRSGTENVADIIGFAKALDLVQARRQAEIIRLKSLQDFFISELKHKLPEVTVNGSTSSRLPSNVHITIPGQDNEFLLMKLDEMGIQCATGSACSADSDSLSTTLLAIGLHPDEVRSSLRFTMGKQTTKQDVAYVVDCLSKIV